MKAATELALDAEDELLFHHSRRVYLWGTLKSRRRGRRPDAEMSYVGAMFHDLGLTPKYRTDHRRFEVDGADIARHFLLDHGYSPEHLSPEIHPVTLGVETDVLGRELYEISNGPR